MTVCFYGTTTEDGVEGEIDGGEEGGVKADADDEETRKLLQKDLVVDKFTRAELHYRKVGSLSLSFYTVEPL